MNADLITLLDFVQRAALWKEGGATRHDALLALGRLGADVPAPYKPTPMPEQVTVRRKCVDCGHEQDVASATSVLEAGGRRAYYFGSAYHHCDKCDGPMATVEEAP